MIRYSAEFCCHPVWRGIYVHPMPGMGVGKLMEPSGAAVLLLLLLSSSSLLTWPCSWLPALLSEVVMLGWFMKLLLMKFRLNNWGHLVTRHHPLPNCPPAIYTKVLSSYRTKQADLWFIGFARFCISSLHGILIVSHKKIKSYNST